MTTPASTRLFDGWPARKRALSRLTTSFGQDGRGGADGGFGAAGDGGKVGAGKGARGDGALDAGDALGMLGIWSSVGGGAVGGDTIGGGGSGGRNILDTVVEPDATLAEEVLSSTTSSSSRSSWIVREATISTAAKRTNAKTSALIPQDAHSALRLL